MSTDLPAVLLVVLVIATPAGSNAHPTKIAFTSNRDGNLEIYSMNPDGSNVQRLTNDPSADSKPSLSPGGTKIAFVSDRDGNSEVYVMGADGSNPVNVTNHPALDGTPAWSPDGALIAFSSDRGGNRDVYVMGADGGSPTNLTNHPSFDHDPDWSPDGIKIAFTSNRDGNEEIYTMDADGSNQVNLTNNAATDRQPSWSPDDARIAFARNSTIWVIDADGGNPEQISALFADDPTWSPDGTQLAVNSVVGGQDEIFTINPDGSGATNLTSNLATDTQPHWGSVALERACVTPPAGMIAWWPGDGDPNDIQGGHDGTLRNGAGVGAGKVAQAFALDGVDDFVEVPDDDAWAFGSGDFTIDLWASFSSADCGPTDSARCTFVATSEGNGSQDKWLFAVSPTTHAATSDNHIYFHVSEQGAPSGSFIALHPFEPVLGRWYHFAVTRQADVYTIYVDGTPIATETNSTSIPNADAPLRLGFGEAPFRSFPGFLDEIEIFSRALSGAEIEALFRADSAGKCRPEQRLSDDDCDGDSIPDPADACPGTSIEETVDLAGCSCAQKACTASDACTTATCDSTTATCTPTTAPEGTSCVGGVCRAGVCTSDAIPSAPTDLRVMLGGLATVKPAVVLSWAHASFSAARPRERVERFRIYRQIVDPSLDCDFKDFGWFSLPISCDFELQQWSLLGEVLGDRSTVLLDGLLDVKAHLQLGYQLAVSAANSSGESALSDPKSAIRDLSKDGFTIVPPDEPVVFVHGVRGDQNTWRDAAASLSSFWTKSKGIDTNDQVISIPDLDRGEALGSAHMYRFAFYDRVAGVPSSTFALDRQSPQLGEVIDAVRTARNTDGVNVVAHSQGGLVARHYLQQVARGAGGVRRLATYGTPHEGANLALAGVAIHDAITTLASLGDQVPTVLVDLPWGDPNAQLDLFGWLQDGLQGLSEGLSEWINSSFLGPENVALRDLVPLPKSAFLQGLDNPNNPLPPEVTYVSLQGRLRRITDILNKALDKIGTPSAQVAAAGLELLGETDGVVAFENQDLAVALGGTAAGLSAVARGRDPSAHASVPYLKEGADHIGVLMGLGYPVLSFRVNSPVSISIIDPDGAFITPNTTCIPGAQYTLDGSVEIPMPAAGNYQIVVTPSPLAGPDDEYTIEMVTDEAIVPVAEAVRVADIPAKPYTVELIPADPNDLDPAALAFEDVNSDGHYSAEQGDRAVLPAELAGKKFTTKVGLTIPRDRSIACGADGVLRLIAKQNLNIFGELSCPTLILKAKRLINLSGASISADIKVVAMARRSLVGSDTSEVGGGLVKFVGKQGISLPGGEVSGEKVALVTRGRVGIQGAAVTSGTDLKILAGPELSANGAELTAGGKLKLKAKQRVKGRSAAINAPEAVLTAKELVNMADATFAPGAVKCKAEEVVGCP